jgi:hypothetical protein
VSVVGNCFVVEGSFFTPTKEVVLILPIPLLKINSPSPPILEIFLEKLKHLTIIVIKRRLFLKELRIPFGVVD